MNIGICGICGRMGDTILAKMIERGHTLGAGFDTETSAMIGKDVDSLKHPGQKPVKINTINDSDTKSVDGFIDFSSPVATLKLLESLVKQKKKLVIGTTGFKSEEIEKIKKAAETIPVLMSPNMSVGVNLLFKLTEIASKALQNEFDSEIFEAHHRFKKDAPSGTAVRLKDIVKESVPELSNCLEVSGREGIIGERTDNELGIFAMRGGDIVGEHTVFFAGTGERIELTHRATSRDIFATGAVMAMEFLEKKGPGLYSMYDVLGL